MAKKQAARKRRPFTLEFTTEAVRLCEVGDRTVRQVAKDPDPDGDGSAISWSARTWLPIQSGMSACGSPPRG